MSREKFAITQDDIELLMDEANGKAGEAGIIFLQALIPIKKYIEWIEDKLRDEIAFSKRRNCFFQSFHFFRDRS